MLNNLITNTKDKTMNAEQFNKENSIGDKVKYQSIIGVTRAIDTVIRSEAWDLPHGDTIVKVAGVSGGVCITHLVN